MLEQGSSPDWGIDLLIKSQVQMPWPQYLWRLSKDSSEFLTSQNVEIVSQLKIYQSKFLLEDIRLISHFIQGKR